MSDDPIAVAIQQIEFLRHRCDMEVAHIAELKEQIKTLRDSLRLALRAYCREAAARDEETCEPGDIPLTAEEIALQELLDCFKEDTK